MPRFADIILPLPLYSSFTYAVPDEFSDTVRIGSRVLVQFGKRKCNTGIVESLHDNAPKNFAPKEILALLDTEPVLRSPQLKFWNWISSYYLCAPGDVMKAALPAALKVESETWVSVNTDFTPGDTALSERQAALYAFISHEKRVRISEIERKVKIPNVRALISRMLDKEILAIAERVVDKYVSRKVTMLTLRCERGDTAGLHSLFDKIGRARKQEKLLIAYLDASGWMHSHLPLRPVDKAGLLQRSECSASILNALIDKGVLIAEQVEINRFSAITPQKDVILPVLSEVQAKALHDIRTSMSARQVTLLRGVTGSGKTEIYSHLIADSLEHGDQVLFLVPEISLTTQLTTRLRLIFGDKLLVYHSKFSDNERVDIWHRLLHSQEPMVILGVRSSVFLPFARLGLIVIDEEHEASYKQYDPAPRYNARCGHHARHNAWRQGAAGQCHTVCRDLL